MDLIAENVAAEVRAQMARRRRTGRSIALELGWSQPYMSRRLSGEVAFNVNDLARIAEVLEVPVTSFFPQVDGVRRPGSCLPPGLAVAA